MYSSAHTLPVVVIIPAHNEAQRIADTVTAAHGLPGIHSIIVVNDGSSDDTAHQAHCAGALVVSHDTCRGKARAMETGADYARRHMAPTAHYLLLFLDADLGSSAAHAHALITPVREGRADLTIAVFPAHASSHGRGRVVRYARHAIRQLTGWSPVAPLCGQRCLSADTLDTIRPLAAAWGVETAMTIDALHAGATVLEVPCDMTHRASTASMRGVVHRARQGWYVMLAVCERRLGRRLRVSREIRTSTRGLCSYEPYSMTVGEQSSSEAAS